MVQDGVSIIIDHIILIEDNATKIQLFSNNFFLPFFYLYALQKIKLCSLCYQFLQLCANDDYRALINFNMEV